MCAARRCSMRIPQFSSGCMVHCMGMLVGGALALDLDLLAACLLDFWQRLSLMRVVAACTRCKL